MTNIEIRQFTSTDKSACMIAFQSNVPLYFTEQEISEFESFLDRIQLMDTDVNRQTYFYVVTDHGNGNVVGCGGFGDKDGKNIISLAWGLIHSNFHKQGLGAALLTFRLKKINELYPSLPLVVDTTQHSFRFFERFGFVTKKITKDYYAPGMHRYDMEFVRSQPVV